MNSSDKRLHQRIVYRTSNFASTRPKKDELSAPAPAASKSLLPSGTVKSETQTGCVKQVCSRVPVIDIIDIDDDSSDDVTVLTGEEEEPSQKKLKSETVVVKSGSRSDSDSEEDEDEMPRRKMKGLPFYAVIHEVAPLKPMVPLPVSDKLKMRRWLLEHRMEFHLSDNHCEMIVNEVKAEVHLRMCHLSDDVVTEYEDEFPVDFDIEINQVILESEERTIGPNLEQSILRKSLDITKSIHLVEDKKNEVIIYWNPEDPPKSYALGVYLLKPLKNEEVIQQIPIFPKSETKEIIQNVLRVPKAGGTQEQDLCCLDTLKVSLICPLTRKPITCPGRCVRCPRPHVQCFDVCGFLEFVRLSNLEKKDRKIKCPVCNVQVEIEDLRIDEYFQSVLKGMARKKCDAKEVEISSDYHWQVVS